MYLGNKRTFHTGGKSDLNEEDPFVVIKDGVVSREKFNTEYLAKFSVPEKDRSNIIVKRVSEI
jgi:hypothetical protein